MAEQKIKRTISNQINAASHQWMKKNSASLQAKAEKFRMNKALRMNSARQ